MYSTPLLHGYRFLFFSWLLYSFRCKARVNPTRATLNLYTVCRITLRHMAVRQTAYIPACRPGKLEHGARNMVKLSCAPYRSAKTEGCWMWSTVWQFCNGCCAVSLYWISSYFLNVHYPLRAAVAAAAADDKETNSGSAPGGGAKLNWLCLVIPIIVPLHPAAQHWWLYFTLEKRGQISFYLYLSLKVNLSKCQWSLGIWCAEMLEILQIHWPSRVK